jgi:hypothetical protein
MMDFTLNDSSINLKVCINRKIKGTALSW